jgi:hypothetical protein
VNGPDIYWLGVHKTGTTFLQACLEASREALERHNLTYEPLDTFRRTYTRPLLDRPDALPPILTSATMSKARRLIFDENILGLVQDVATPEGLYPTGAWRADEMADRLDLENPRLVLGLRGFAGFLPSLYCEALKATPFQSFRKFLRTPPEHLSWQPLVANLLVAFPRTHLTIYTAETLLGQETALLSYLLDLPKPELTRADHSERRGFSQRAVEKMNEVHKARGIEIAEVKRLAEDYPRGPEMPGFDPWERDERDRLNALYTADLEALRTWPRVTLIDPASL